MSPRSSGPILVVDFGTSASSAALVSNGVVRRIAEPSSGSWSWPTAVYLDKDSLLVGTQAESRKKVDPAKRYRAEFKRELGQNTPIYLDERPFQPEDLVKVILHSLHAEAVRLNDGPVERALLTVPAAYSPADPRRDLMIKAAQGVGLKVVELIAEPVAAALAPPAGQPFEPGDTILVYDFGGGTFDAALVRLGDYRFSPDVLGHRSLDDCGGRDIDAALFARLRADGPAELAGLLAVDPDADQAKALAGLRTRLEFAELTQDLKHQLSEVRNSIGVFRSMEFELDLDEFASVADSFVTRTLQCCEELLQTAGVPAANVRAVMLAGGSSKMKLVAETLAKLNIPVRPANDPQHAILEGAVAFAAKADDRAVTPAAGNLDERAVRWALPEAGVGTMQRWLVEISDRYSPDDLLAEVRLPSGTVIGLRDSERGVVAGRHAPVGTRVESNDWLLTSAKLFRPWRHQVGRADGYQPVATDKSVYFASASGDVFCLTAADGALRYRIRLPAQITSGLALADNRLYVGCADSFLRTLDSLTGGIIDVEYKAGGAIRATPAVSEGVAYFGCDDNRLHAVDVTAGKFLWSRPIGSTRTSSVVSGDMLYVPIAGSYIHAVGIADGMSRWKHSYGSQWPILVHNNIIHFAVTNSNIIKMTAADGKSAKGFTFRSATRVVRSGTAIFAAASDGSLAAIDEETYQVLWKTEINQKTPQWIAAAGGFVYLGRSDGHILAYRISDQAIQWDYATGGAIASDPVVHGDTIYVTSADGYLYALDAVSGAPGELEEK